MKRLAIVLKALADANRIRIVKLLEKRGMCVCELAHILGISQPAVSKHLKKMLEAGLLDFRQEGFWTDYYVCPKNPYAEKFLRTLKQFPAEDRVLRKDAARAAKADRKKLCILKK